MRPPLKTLMATSYGCLGSALVAVAIVGAVLDWWKGRPWQVLELDASAWAFFLGMPAALGLIFAASTWPFAVTIAHDGLRGRGRWGRPTFLRWREIDTVEPLAGEVAGIRPTNAKTRARVTMYLVGADVPRIHAELARWAGADHVLTQCFAAAISGPAD